MQTSSLLIHKALEEVTHIFRREMNGAPYYYHNLEHTLAVWHKAVELAAAEQLNEIESESLELATLFHDSGYAAAPHRHEAHSGERAREFMSRCKLNAARQDEVCNLIMCTLMDKEPRTTAEMVMRDADLHYLGTADYFRQADALRQEWKEVEKKILSDEEWYQVNIRFFEKHKFYTATARRLYEGTKAHNLQMVRQSHQQLSANISK